MLSDDINRALGHFNVFDGGVHTIGRTDVTERSDECQLTASGQSASSIGTDVGRSLTWELLYLDSGRCSNK